MFHMKCQSDVIRRSFIFVVVAVACCFFRFLYFIFALLRPFSPFQLNFSRTYPKPCNTTSQQQNRHKTQSTRFWLVEKDEEMQKKPVKSVLFFARLNQHTHVIKIYKYIYWNCLFTSTTTTLFSNILYSLRFFFVVACFLFSYSMLLNTGNIERDETFVKL